jgi:hypothetical protein
VWTGSRSRAFVGRPVAAALTAAAIASVVGLSWETSTAAPAVVEPDPPTVAASASGTTITVTWAATGTGGAPIDGFEVTVQQVGEPGTPAACSGTPSATPGLLDGSSCTATGVPGTSYEVAVRARNEAGYSLPVATSVAVVPAAPTVTATASGTMVTVDWSATGRHPETIDGFEVTVTRAGSPSTTVACSGTAAAAPDLLAGSSCTANGVPGASYDIAVKAHNGAGFSDAGTATAGVAAAAGAVPSSAPAYTDGNLAAQAASITPDAVGPAGPADSGLAVTGAPIATTVLLGLLLIAIGAATRVAGRRRA